MYLRPRDEPDGVKWVDGKQCSKETVSLDEKERNVSWCEREMRNDIGGRIGLVGVEKLSFTNEVESEKVDKQILSGAGVEEGE